MTDLDSILKDHGLRRTVFRKELLSLFVKSKSTLTVEEIRRRVGVLGDKVTIYRALEAFEKGGLIHKVPDKSNLTRYALCQVGCTSNKHTHHHAHLICTDCNETYCVEGVEIPEIKGARGFIVKETNVTLEGVCPDCNQKNLK